MEHSSINRPLRKARPASSQPLAATRTGTTCQPNRCRSSSPSTRNTGHEPLELRSTSEETSLAISHNQASQSSPVTCHHCGRTNKRKRHIKCDSCGRYWHLTCAHIKRAEADALTRWWCSRCVGIGDCTQAEELPLSREAETGPDAATSEELRPDYDLAPCLAGLRQNRRVIRRIPKGARIVAADAMTVLVEAAVKHNTVVTWVRLLLFPYLALHAPERATGLADNTSLTSKIKRQIDSYMSPASPNDLISSIDASTLKQPSICKRGQRKKSENNERLQRGVAAKLEDGDVRGAIRLLASKDKIAQNSHDIIESLQHKHPSAPDDLSMPAGPDDSTQPSQVNESEVVASIASFNNGSSAGLDGLRPAHLKDLTSRSAGEAGVRLITALTALANLVLRGDVPKSVCAAFFGAALIAFHKPDGGVRPIAVGNTYRRLSTKLALKSLSAELGEQLRPTQLGYGTAGGCEAAVHSTRRFSETLSGDSAIIKLDMRNAFNSVRRDHFLRQVRERAPSMYPLLWQAYSEPTPLFCGTHMITSATGLQQGDPSGPAVFALAIDQVITAVTAPFNCWYLDDGTIGGKVSTICSDLKQLIPGMARIGLNINPNKCEIIFPADVSDEQRSCAVTSLHQLIPGAAVLQDSERIILGAPISEDAAEAAIVEKREELEYMIGRLRQLDAHVAFFLLRNCLWLPKLQNLLRASPLYRHSGSLRQLDAILQSAVSNISNVNLTGDCWEQAVLPTRYGGLGLRRLADVALPSYVSSLYGCHPIILACLPASLATDVTEEREKATADWQAAAGGEDVPTGSDQLKQKAWDSVLAQQNQRKLLSESNQFSRARLLSAAAPESGAWLHSTPAATLGTLLDRETLRIAIALRVGADVCIPHRCKCGSVADSKGYHALTCKFSAGRHPRHTVLNDTVRRALLSAGIPSLTEPIGVDRGDGKRPDGITLYPFSKGMSLAWDATCVNTFAESHVLSAATSAGAAAREAEDNKRKKYVDLQRRFHFEPLAFETTGACGPSTKLFVRDLGARITSTSGDRRETAWLWQRLALAIVRGNAASVLLTTDSDDLPRIKSVAHDGYGMHSRGSSADKSHQRRAPTTAQRRVNQPDEAADRAASESIGPPDPSAGEARSDAPSAGTESSANENDIERWVRTPSLLCQYIATKESAARSPPGITGLENLGSTCYMNAVLQVLAQTQDLVDYMKSEFFYEYTTANSVNTNPVSKELAQLLDVIWSEKFRYVSPHRFRSVVSARRRDFGGVSMHDAHEFIILLLEWLHDELNVAAAASARPTTPASTDLTASETAETVWRQFQRVNDSIVTRLFHGLQKSTLLCTACGFESVTFETFSLLSLPLAEPPVDCGSLYHCLEQYVRGDLITDWTCPKCQCCHDAHKKLDLCRLPPVLILHLKSFSFAGNATRKTHVQVSFPLRDLDLSQLAIGTHPSHSLVYDLYGVVEHHGSQHRGHYTAYCFNQPAASWFSMNDNAVRESSAGKVKDATAYLLCYHARDRVVV